MYAKNCLKDSIRDAKELKEKIAKRDKETLAGLLYFGTSIRGSAQFFKKEQLKGFNFIRHTRIKSEDKRYVNLFLTFSPADLHWKLLHDILPEDYTKHYLNKNIVKAKKDIPHGEDPTDYITESQDYQFRLKAISENADICNFFFRKKLKLLFTHVLQPLLNVTDYKIRFEFQHRGSIHAHMVVVIENGITAIDLQNSMDVKFEDKSPQDEQASDDHLTDEEDENGHKIKDSQGETVQRRQKRIYSQQCLDARKKIIEFAKETVLISAEHPNLDPTQWPAPYGSNVHKPRTIVLRELYQLPKVETLKFCQETYEKIVNYCLLHTCKLGYCMKTKDSGCKHHFPFQFHGYEPKYVTICQKEMLETVTKKSTVPKKQQ